MSYNQSRLLYNQYDEGGSLVSGSNKCGQCAHKYIALTIPFILAGITLVAFNIL